MCPEEARNQDLTVVARASRNLLDWTGLDWTLPVVRFQLCLTFIRPVTRYGYNSHTFKNLT
jgi:hypothetical protein